MSTPAPHTAAANSVLREDRGAVARITLNRPDTFNALSLGMLKQLERVLGQVAADRGVRVVVVGGNGPAFCPGHDLKEMLAERTPAHITELFETCSRVMLSLAQLPQPVIARVHGIATAAGCQLVAACDLAIASSAARFATSGIDYGLFCATPAVPISRVLGRKRALEMLLTGEFISAQTACEWGLVNRVVLPESLDAAVDELCATLLAKPPVALAEGKRFFYSQLGLDMAAAYEEAARLLTHQVLSDEGLEGMSAFAAKRPPRWER